jgi:hypothetical protein
MVEGRRVSGEREGEVRKVMGMNLRLICASTHNPFTIFADPDASACFFEFEILEKLDSICVLGVVFQAPLPFSGKPIWQRTGGRSTGYRVDWHLVGIRELHRGTLVGSPSSREVSWWSAQWSTLHKIFTLFSEGFSGADAKTSLWPRLCMSGSGRRARAHPPQPWGWTTNLAHCSSIAPTYDDLLLPSFLFRLDNSTGFCPFLLGWSPATPMIATPFKERTSPTLQASLTARRRL